MKNLVIEENIQVMLVRMVKFVETTWGWKAKDVKSFEGSNYSVSSEENKCGFYKDTHNNARQFAIITPKDASLK